ncbi:MAG: PaaI family thioesterase [Gammaproteobacteria bacterium]|nr:PaaI family thioesterase [Gammaproteobacteria bacterium]
MSATSPEQHIADQVKQHLDRADGALLAEFGISVRELRPGFAELSMEVAARWTNSVGLCHGGIVFTLADTALIYAMLSRNEICVTLNANISFARPARGGDSLLAQARLLSGTRNTALAEVSITNQHGDLVAHAQATGFKQRDQLLLPTPS